MCGWLLDTTSMYRTPKSTDRIGIQAQTSNRLVCMCSPPEAENALAKQFWHTFILLAQGISGRRWKETTNRLFHLIGIVTIYSLSVERWLTARHRLDKLRVTSCWVTSCTGDKVSGDKLYGRQVAGDKLCGWQSVRWQVVGWQSARVTSCWVTKCAGDKLFGWQVVGWQIAGDKWRVTSCRVTSVGTPGIILKVQTWFHLRVKFFVAASSKTK